MLVVEWTSKFVLGCTPVRRAVVGELEPGMFEGVTEIEGRRERTLYFDFEDTCLPSGRQCVLSIYNSKSHSRSSSAAASRLMFFRFFFLAGLPLLPLGWSMRSGIAASRSLLLPRLSIS